MIRLALVDENAIVCDGLSALLSEQKDLRVMGCAHTADQAIDLCRDTNPDIAVMGSEFAGMDAMTFIGRLKKESPDTRIAVTGLNGSSEYGARLLLCGAAAVAPVSLTGDKLPEFLRNTMSQDFYVAEDIRDQVFASMLAMSRRRTNKLSKREMQVFAAYARGRKRAEIATDLGINPRTVETHRRRIMQKLNIKSTAALIKAAISEGVVDSL